MILKRIRENFSGYEKNLHKKPVVSAEGIFALIMLFLLSLVAVAYHQIRISYSSAMDFSPDWNLFLSWIPLLVAYMAGAWSKKFPERHIMLILLSFIWLLFFPNAPYMITDLVHLSVDYGRMLTWHDAVMLFYYAQVSLINGLVSLYWMHRAWQRSFSIRTGNWILVACLPFAGLGIFLGRIERLNSWDLFQDSTKIFAALGQSFTDKTAVVMSLEFGLLIGALYAVLWAVLCFRAPR